MQGSDAGESNRLHFVKKQYKNDDGRRRSMQNKHAEPIKTKRMLHANAIFPVSENVTKTRDHTTVHAYSDEQVKMNSFVRVIFHTQPNKLTC